MAARINTLTFSGVDVIDIDVQAHMTGGLPTFTVVGLPDKTIAESKERVRAALNSIGLTLPAKRITVNLAPADILKEGSHFDLPIALALLVTMHILPEEELYNYFVMGELALDGNIMPVNGILPATIGATARSKGMICPEVNGTEAAWSGNNSIIAAPNILAIINHFKGTQLLNSPIIAMNHELIPYADLADIKGQNMAKHALFIAACGAHNILMSGPPGAGKSMLAQRLAGILPKMNIDEILECSMVASIAGKLVNGKLQYTRPFRAPHHSCSMPAMVGGGMGKKIMPGEISLAHNGVLFLDELPEFPRIVLDALRQPTETGEILISRSGHYIKFPARFQLIAAMNPCRCGYLGDSERSCNRAPRCALDYQAKISGPMLDRIDIHIEVPPLKASDMQITSEVTNSQTIYTEVERVRKIQVARYEGYNIRTNAELDGKLLIEYATPNNKGLALLNKAVEKFKLSMRGYNRVLRVARTIADIENVNIVCENHIAEALNYRQPIIKKL